jgi:ankyrin repeat protein
MATIQNHGVYPFVVSSLYMNGYGTPPDLPESRKFLIESMRHGYMNAYAYIYRVFQAHGIQVSKEGAVDNLAIAAYYGSRPALQDLANVLNAKEYAFQKQRLQRQRAGVGAAFFDKEYMLNSLDYGLLSDPTNFKRLCTNDPDAVINARGDKLIQFAASCGFLGHVEYLIELQIDVNQINGCGETALLAACRAGHKDMALYLLQHNGNPTISAGTGETALHWLISFDDSDAEEIGQLLVNAGADANAVTRTRVCHSRLRGTIDVDFQRPSSTPLTWAVHHDRPTLVVLLMRWGASPLSSKGFPPLQLAAYMHHEECLRSMYTKLEEEGANVDLRVLLSSAAHASDLFSMILRNGSTYAEKFKRTLDFLRDKIIQKGVEKFSLTCDGYLQSLLYDAILESHPYAAQYMVDHRIGFNDIHEPGGESQKTALLAAVYRNQRELVAFLIKHGADPMRFEMSPITRIPAVWTVLHEFAWAGHNDDVTLAEDFCTKWQMHVDARRVNLFETPVMLAIHTGSFKLADLLLKLGADINALSFHYTFLKSLHSMTILGHIIISNAMHSEQQIEYICSKRREDGSRRIQFVVEPDRQLTVLHRAAWAQTDILYWAPDSTSAKHQTKVTNNTPTTRNFKKTVPSATNKSGGRHESPSTSEESSFQGTRLPETPVSSSATLSSQNVESEQPIPDINRRVLLTLLAQFNTPEELNLKSRHRGWTALHFAVDARNFAAYAVLKEAGADIHVPDDAQISPNDMLRSISSEVS